MNRTSTRASLAALLAASLLLAGCNGDDKGGDEPTKAAPDTTTSASTDASPSASSGATGSGSGLDKADFYEKISAAQQAAGSYRAKATTTAAGSSTVMNAEISYRGDEVLGHIQSGAGSAQQLEGVLSGGVLYLKGAGLGVPAGKWLKYDSEDPANANSPFAGLVGATDPGAALRALGDPKQLDLVGTEDVDGVKADHYKAVMSTTSYAQTLKLPAEVAKTLPAELPVEIWVDEQNRPVKTTTTFTIAGTTSTTEQKYFDYGAKVSVTVPKDSDTVTPADIGLKG